MQNPDYNFYNPSVADFIPIACHYDANTLITKNGQLLQTIQINGINADKISDKLFNLRSFVRKAISSSVDNHNYAFWVHTIRKEVNLDDNAPYHGILSANIHDVWQHKNYWRSKYVNMLYITVVHHAPELKLNNFSALVKSFYPNLIIKEREKFFATAEKALTKTVDNILKELADYGAHKLGLEIKNENCYSELMLLFSRIVHFNDNECPLPMSDISTTLASCKYKVGSDKIEVSNIDGKKFATIMSIKEYHEVSAEALDKFLQIPVEMVATEVFYFVEKDTVINAFEHQNYILEVSKDEELKKIKGLDKIFTEIDEITKFCHQQISFMVIADDINDLDARVKQASQALAKMGIVHVKEDINLEKTFWAQLPGNFSFLARMKPTLIENIAALASLHNFPTGNQYSPWGRALTLLRTEKGTPYFMNFHDRIGGAKICIFGKKDSGKTTLMNFLLSESDKYLPKVIYITDSLNSEIYIKARGGKWWDQSKNIINPFLCTDSDENRAYIFEFFKIIAKHDFDPLNQEELDILQSLSDTILSRPYIERKLSIIIASLKDQIAENTKFHQRFADYLEGGIYYQIFETEETLSIAKGEIAAFCLRHFDDKNYIKNNYPKEKKLIEEFEYNLNSMRAVKAALVLALTNVLVQKKEDTDSIIPKVLVIDNLTEMLNMRYYQHLIGYCSKSIESANGVFFTSASIESLMDDPKQLISHSWIKKLNTSIILPADIISKDTIEVLNITPMELKKLSGMNHAARTFLIKQDEQAVASELSIGGLASIVAILSSDELIREVYQETVKEYGEAKIEDWLDPLYQKLGIGK